MKINYQFVSISISISILYIKKDNWAACVKQNNNKKIKIVKARYIGKITLLLLKIYVSWKKL